jgi:DNA-binding transcriptional LysR family regulator
VGAAPPHVRLRFAPKPLKNAAPLRKGVVDLEIGVLGDFAPEVRAQGLFSDRFLGVVRTGHSLLKDPIVPERYAACRHVVASRRGSFEGPVDAALAALGLRRAIVAAVPGFPDTRRVASTSDLVALVPWSCLGPRAIPEQPFTYGLVSFELPVKTPEITC